MKKNIAFTFLLSLAGIVAWSQKVSGKPKFEMGQTFEVILQVKTTIAQQAMGQAIDFNVDATGNHSYKVTNATEDNTTLHHQVNGISFVFDGMGQKRSFDSNNEKDINGPFGKPIKDILSKPFDIIIDPNGKTLMAAPEKVQIAESDSRMAIITNMMREVFDIVQPPQKGGSSFFRVLPENAVGKAEPWTESWQNENGKYNAAYSISDINDSTVIIDVVANSTTVLKAELMGSPTTTTMNNKSTGKIIVDKASGIIREKTITTESNGNTEASFGTLPVTSKMTTTITVKPVTQ